MVSPANKGLYQQIYDKIGFFVSHFCNTVYDRTFGPTRRRNAHLCTAQYLGQWGRGE
jgi:hypothetical protein